MNTDIGHYTPPDSPGSKMFINTIDYTYLELFLFAGGCLLWVVAYALLIRNARKYQIAEMPVIAACSNFAWEILWSIPFKTDMGYFLVWTYRAWLILDCYIIYAVLQYGHKIVVTPFIKKHFKPIAISTIFAFLILYYFFIQQGYGEPIGANTAYIAQLFISAGYLIAILNLRDLTGFSQAIAYLRTIGTCMNTVFMLIHYPHNHFLYTMGILAFVLDSSYIYIYQRRLKGMWKLPD